MRRALVAAAAVGLAAAAVASAAAPPADPVQKHTAKDVAAARSVLLVRADLGAQWQAVKGKVAALTCPSFQPTLKGVVETGAAASPNFSAGNSGPFVTQIAWVYRTAAQASTLWRRVVGAGLERCLADAVTSGSTKDVTFTVEKRLRFALPRLVARAAGYRVLATAATTGQTVDVVYDMVVLGRGRAVTAITLAEFSGPVPAELELRLARRTAARLAALPVP
ncbi:MAG: hypothetical protein ACXVZL_02460 [Gaiellaceae bacterium]